MNFICVGQESIKFQLLNKLNLPLGKIIVESLVFVWCLSRQLLFFCDDICAMSGWCVMSPQLGAGQKKAARGGRLA